MKNWGSLKINYFSQLLRNISHSEARKRRRISKAGFFATPLASLRMTEETGQTLTELATFGSILLLVLSFFISYGMRYNYQQEMQMRSFRKALSEAYASGRPDASASVTLVKDRHIPDPRDMFGAGSVTPVIGQAQATWGNTLQDTYNVPATTPTNPLATDLPRTEYKVNDISHPYTTANYYTTDTTLSDYYFEVPGIGRKKISKTYVCPNQPDTKNIRIYNPDPVEDPGHPGTFLPATQVMINFAPPCSPVTWDVVNAVALSEKGPLMQIIKVYPENGSDGDPVDHFCLLNPTTGQINPEYMQLNNDVDRNGTPDVTPANVQGLLLDSEQNIRRSGTLTVTETPATTTSTSTYSFTDKDGNPTTITHKIRGNSGTAVPAAPTDIPYTFPRSGTSTWTTPK